MKKRNNIEKEVKKIKKSKDSKVNKRRNQSEPDLLKEMRSSWKVIRTNLKPKERECCVYCSYGSVKCPPIQKGESC